MPRRLIVGLALFVTGVAFLAGYEWASWPATYEQAIAEVFEQRKIAFTRLETRQLCLPDPSCTIHEGTSTSIAVFIYHAHVSYGQVTCYSRGGDCYLDCATLNVAGAPLRDLRHVRLRATAPGRVGEMIMVVVDRLVGQMRRKSSYR